MSFLVPKTFLIHFYHFIPKVLLKDQNMLNLIRIKNYERGHSDPFWQTEAGKTTGFYVKICIRACLEIEKTQVVCCAAVVTPKINILC